jgi:hypothetical protein
VFGLDRRDLTKHAKRCLVGERRRRVEADLQKMAAGAEGGG